MHKNLEIELACLCHGQEDKFALYLKDENLKRTKGLEPLITLSYPVEKKDEQDTFNDFFQSPFRVKKFSHTFKGLFAINLTDYLELPSNLMLSNLRDYTEENPTIDFILFAYTNTKSLADSFQKRLFKIFEASSRPLVNSSFKMELAASSRVQKTERNFGY